jgi:hypothetical protein
MRLQRNYIKSNLENIKSLHLSLRSVLSIKLGIRSTGPRQKLSWSILITPGDEKWTRGPRSGRTPSSTTRSGTSTKQLWRETRRLTTTLKDTVWPSAGPFNHSMFSHSTFSRSMFGHSTFGLSTFRHSTISHYAFGQGFVFVCIHFVMLDVLLL